MNFLPKWIVTFEKSYNKIIKTVEISITVKTYIINRTTEIGISLGKNKVTTFSQTLSKSLKSLPKLNLIYIYIW